MDKRMSAELQDIVSQIATTTKDLKRLGHHLDNDETMTPDESDINPDDDQEACDEDLAIATIISGGLEETVRQEIRDQVSVQQKKPSGSDPFMLQKDMSKDIRYSKKYVTSKGLSFMSLTEEEAEQIIFEWSKDTKKGLRKNERQCLIDAFSAGIVEDDGDFEKILFGFNLRGEQNVIECKNVFQAVQENTTRTIAKQAEFERAAIRILDGFAQLKSKTSETPKASASTIPAVKMVNIDNPPPLTIKNPPLRLPVYTAKKHQNKIIDITDDQPSDLVTKGEKRKEGRDNSEDLEPATVSGLTAFINKDKAWMDRVFYPLDREKTLDGFILDHDIIRSQLNGSSAPLWKKIVAYVKVKKAEKIPSASDKGKEVLEG